MPDLLSLARGLGLNEYESKAYLAVTRLGNATAAKISRAAELPRARVYDVLVSLEKKGFVAKRPVKPVEYVPVHIDQALQGLQQRMKDQFDFEVSKIHETRDLLKSELEKYASDAPLDAAHLIEGRRNIYNHLSTHLQGVQKKILLVSSPEGLAQKELQLGKKLHALSERGIQVEKRTSNHSRYVVLDNTLVLLFLNPLMEEEPAEKALLIRSPFLAHSLQEQL